MASPLLHAENWEVMTIEVEKKLVEPTLVRSLDSDWAKVAETIDKLRNLGASGRVRVNGPYSVDVGDGMKSQGAEDLKVELDGRKYGVELNWDREGKNRDILVSRAPLQDNRAWFRLSAVHDLDGQWSLSGALATSMGALFFFERIPERHAKPGKISFVAMALRSGGKPADQSGSDPGKWFSESAVSASIFREVGEGHLPMRMESKLFTPSRMSGATCETVIHMTVARGRNAEAGSMLHIIGTDILMESDATSLLHLKGSSKHQFAAGKHPAVQTSKLDASLEVSRRTGENVARTATNRPAPEYWFQSMSFETKGQ